MKQAEKEFEQGRWEDARGEPPPGGEPDVQLVEMPAMDMEPATLAEPAAQVLAPVPEEQLAVPGDDEGLSAGGKGKRLLAIDDGAGSSAATYHGAAAHDETEHGVGGFLRRCCGQDHGDRVRVGRGATMCRQRLGTRCASSDG